jgi:diketogulonate reductase-like aldo/keto reductase
MPSKFHWQDYANDSYIQAIEILSQLKAEGLISAIGLCNFDSVRTEAICTQVSGVIVSNQVQVPHRWTFSLIYFILIAD